MIYFHYIIRLTKGEREIAVTLGCDVGSGVLDVQWSDGDPEMKAILEDHFKEMALLEEYSVMARSAAIDHGFTMTTETIGKRPRPSDYPQF